MVVIILVNFNNYSDTLECVKSILDSDSEDYHIIIVDNCSKKEDYIELYMGLKNIFKFEGTVTEWFEDNDVFLKNDIITCLRTSHNGGFAFGNNIGVKYSEVYFTVNYFWFLNNDTIIKKDSLIRLIDYIEENEEKIGILGSLLINYNSDIIQSAGCLYNKISCYTKHIGKGLQINHFHKNKRKIDFVSGASMFVKKEFIDEIGYMCEDYFLYFEELDWVIRGRQKFWITDICLNSIVYHKEGASIGSCANLFNRTILSDFYGIRNRILFTKKNYGKYLIFAYLSCIYALIRRVFYGKYEYACMIMKIIYDSIFSKDFYNVKKYRYFK